MLSRPILQRQLYRRLILSADRRFLFEMDFLVTNHFVLSRKTLLTHLAFKWLDGRIVSQKMSIQFAFAEERLAAKRANVIRRSVPVPIHMHHFVILKR